MNWDPEHADPRVGSFLPGLRWAVEHTMGPVLELGGGYFSTPYLHDLFRSGRPVTTYEFDPEWARELGLRFDHPITTHFDQVFGLGWSVVLVDCEGWNRQAFVDALRPRTQVLVVHDSQDPWVDNLHLFRYRYDFDTDPRTTLVSDRLDVRDCGC